MRPTRTVLLALSLLVVVPLASCQQVATPNLKCVWSGMTVTELHDSDGTVFAQAKAPATQVVLSRLEGDLTLEAAQVPATVESQPPQRTFAKLSGAGEGTARLSLAPDAGSGDLIVEQEGTSGPGLHDIYWRVQGIPLDYSIIIPGRSGIRLDRNTPGTTQSFTYPQSWEAQFVIIQGRDRGFWIWAEDTEGQFKSLTANRRATGWELVLGTQNLAPFEDKSTIRSVRWHLGTYRGDWTVPASRYRTWAAANFGLVPLAQQRPAWVKDVRAMFICGMDLETLRAIAGVCDPRQTVLYVPSWRRDGYDINYPDYTPLPALEPFLAEAHRLGFRVMLHVNYFGCDLKNPLYETFKPYHVRDAFRKEYQWWIPPSQKKWTDREPTIKFAYINPASRAWRELLVSRLKKLCTDYDVDALHLDQTLCIYNEAAGRVDGMTMVEGNLALHRELREALPEVALSGEGLNEVTFRMEAFAQRHAWGVNHSEGTWNRSQIDCAHPISSFLFCPYTTINGYLGMTSPSNEQYYAAWRQAYVNWGVIPTFAHVGLAQLKDPTGFTRQLLGEIAFFQREKVDPDLYRAWRPDTLFPYRTASGQPVEYVRKDGFALIAGSGPASQVVSQTLTGVSQVTGEGSVSGWPAYNAQGIFGLHTDAWYPFEPQTSRDLAAPHLDRAPSWVTVDGVTSGPDMLAVRTSDAHRVVAWVADLLGTGRSGYTVFGGAGEEQEGELAGSAAGARFTASSRELISLHPPWKGERKDPAIGTASADGTGEVYAVLRVTLPEDGASRFLSGVCLEPGALGEGKSDGVTYIVEATSEGKTLRSQVHTAQATAVPLELDLAPFRGKGIQLRLTVDPGPARNPSFDWARWESPRIEVDRTKAGDLEVVAPPRQDWVAALSSSGTAQLSTLEATRYLVRAPLPGSVYLLKRKPQAVSLPCDLTGCSFSLLFLTQGGQQLTAPQYAAGAVGEASVLGLQRRGFTAHPPNRGRTLMEFPLQMPQRPALFRAEVGLREGSLSDGCLFVVEVSGKEVARKLIVPGQWETLEADLSPWAGKPVVLSVVTDSDKAYDFDWAMWGNPRLEPEPEPAAN
ncbi:MAG: DUF6259 domain-containing protein [Armatimonadia bacterium]